ncbi:unnamed protein product [Owenia fusiformis]|uniref:Uncharacterized protein n=1 Tax=Owenia fusiformis TaxID=6347 RepID=A0A8J1UAT7_OWEFU|nr:unnamed protein product [Owenia fusiformis]
MVTMLGLILVLMVGSMAGMKAHNEDLHDTVSTLAKQLMMQQLMFEERIRSDGDSGLKQCRVNNGGTKPYHMPSYSSKKGAGSCHDHSNHMRTLGIGEFVAVLNGVEFRTRHNDYLLRMPSRSSIEYEAMEDIPFPDVPQSVLAQTNVKDQIHEMQQYFKAFQNQDSTIRNYKPYFKPVLCYLEGAWTTDSDDTITEPYESDRHWLDAHSWKDLEQKIRFNAYAGRKSTLENYAFLPRKIMSLINDTIPVMAQWNYRILCHPLKKDLPTDRFRVVDDLGTRMMFYRNLDQHTGSRRARFQLPTKDAPWNEYSDKMTSHRELLDELMEQIPGKDNYGAFHVDEAFGLKAHKVKSLETKNAGYYHRWYQTDKKGAMGLSLRHRGFADKNVFMAMTRQTKVAPMEVEDCKGEGSDRVCKKYKQRWTYAIPLEIVYMTPLLKWNPYDIEYKGDASSPKGQSVEENGKRTGGFSRATAYNGTHHQLYYHTPAEFFQGRVVDVDKADTFKGSSGVLDKRGIVRPMTSSGTRVVLPNIPYIGMVRQRYPIMPIHSEGNAIWKELSALKDIIMDLKHYGYMMEKLPDGSKPKLKDYLKHSYNEKGYKFYLDYASGAPGAYVGRHRHHFILLKEDMETLKSRRPVTVITTENNGHSHMITVRIPGSRAVGEPKMFRCDGEEVCWDGHTRMMHIKRDGEAPRFYNGRN